MGCGRLSKSKAKEQTNEKKIVISPTKFIRENDKKVLDVYNLTGLIGEGTYGKVFEACHKTLNLVRAIKIINKRNIKDTKVRFKFLNEIAILKVLDHPNILKLYEFFEDSRNYYLVTDYLNGGELLDYILKNKVLSETETAKYIKQVLESVSYLHSNNIVHRDIKLENLVLESHSPDALLKLIDFGISVIQNPRKKLRNRKGTISYLAPEVIDSTYNEKCDIWSIGVIMYVLLSGKMPFGGRNEEEILNSIRKGVYKLSGNEWSRVSIQGIDLLKKLLSYDANSRISAQDALSHEWFSLHPEEKVNASEYSSVLSNLLSFRASFKLQRAVMCFIASQLLTKAELTELNQIFRSLDVDGKGKVTENELYNACVRVWGERIPKEEMNKIVKEIDIDGNGFIDYTEFILASMNKEKMLTTERLEATFNLFDKDGSGKITAKELKEILEIHDVEDSSWDNLIAEVDSNGDGGVDLKEFKDMMLALL